MSNPVIHFEVVGGDANGLQRFYAEAFGWRIEPAASGYAMALTGSDRGIHGGIGAPPEGGAGRVTFYIEVADLEATLADVGQRGGSTVSAPIDVPDGPRFALFADPDGHVVGLLEANSRQR